MELFLPNIISIIKSFTPMIRFPDILLSALKNKCESFGLYKNHMLKK